MAVEKFPKTIRQRGQIADEHIIRVGGKTVYATCWKLGAGGEPGGGPGVLSAGPGGGSVQCSVFSGSVFSVQWVSVRCSVFSVQCFSCYLVWRGLRDSLSKQAPARYIGVVWPGRCEPAVGRQRGWRVERLALWLSERSGGPRRGDARSPRWGRAGADSN